MALTDKLSAIGVAIRQKTGSSALMTLDEMPGAIASITTGGGGGGGDCNGLHIPDEALVITNGTELFKGGKWMWFFDLCKDKLSTEGLTYTTFMFESCTSLTEIPFELNGSGSPGHMNSMFCWSMNLESIAPLNNFHPEQMANMFQYCQKLRELPEFNNFNWSTLHELTYSQNSYMFQYCHSLRSIPESLLKELYSATTSSYSSFLYGMFTGCYVLNEIRGLRGPNAICTSNLFVNTFDNCSHVKSIVFATNEDGTPLVQNWKNQVIDLTKYVGYFQYRLDGPTYGLTEDNLHYEEDYDPLTRDDVPEGDDWWSTQLRFSRYNKNSAVETINSLPDTSAAGGINTIKFKKMSGSSFGYVAEGNASARSSLSISTLTEEEIAVATAKGWTVTLVD